MARRPARRHTRRGTHFSSSRRGIKARTHRCAAAAVHRHGTDLGAGVRLVTAHALPFPAQEGSARRLAHRSVVRRRRAQGHGLSRSYEPSRATLRATRLACGLAQSAPWCVATAVLATRDLAMPARRSHLVTRGAARGGRWRNHQSLHKNSMARRPVPQKTLARRRRGSRA
jgi:hypothetical protein